MNLNIKILILTRRNGLILYTDLTEDFYPRWQNFARFILFPQTFF